LLVSVFTLSRQTAVCRMMSIVRTPVITGAAVATASATWDSGELVANTNVPLVATHVTDLQPTTVWNVAIMPSGTLKSDVSARTDTLASFAQIWVGTPALQNVAVAVKDPWIPTATSVAPMPSSTTMESVAVTRTGAVTIALSTWLVICQDLVVQDIATRSA
jgi:hypothetical protein